MNFSKVSLTFVAAVSAAMLGGCGGGALQSSPPASNVVPRAAWQSRLPQSHRGSWMSPAAKGNNLVYISNFESPIGVYVYSYPGGTPMGMLTGFTFPQGECVDKSGDVFITDEVANDIVEYAHGGTTPIQTLSDPGAGPNACSIDPTTGNLAVANIVPSGSGFGTVSIYAGATGSPSVDVDPFMAFLSFCGYDNQGHLFVDGSNSAFNFELDEFAGGGFQQIELDDLTITTAGAIQWDGRFLDLGDPGAVAIYGLVVDPSTNLAYLGRTTTLNNARLVWQYWVQGRRVVAPDRAEGIWWLYHYPAGGNPTRGISPLSAPYGAAVSKGP